MKKEKFTLETKPVWKEMTFENGETGKVLVFNYEGDEFILSKKSLVMYFNELDLIIEYNGVMLTPDNLYETTKNARYSSILANAETIEVSDEFASLFKEEESEA